MDRADYLWHLAGVAEVKGEQQTAVHMYQQLLDETSMLPLHIREWYRGTAAYGLARCAARCYDTVVARRALIYALEHHLWNQSLPTSDSILTSMVSARWIDSLYAIWSTVRESEKRFWHTQPDVVWTPLSDNKKHPLIIAMHGGNASFERFADRWRLVAVELGAVVVVPAGIDRVTEVTNSWGLTVSRFEEIILKTIDQYSSRPDVDPRRVYLAGFSQGAHAALELALRHSDRIKGAIAISGFIADTVSEASMLAAKKNGVRLYCMSGDMEIPEFKNSITTAVEDCKRRGIQATLETIPDMIHEIPLDFLTRMEKAWAWVTARPSSASNR